MEEEMIHPRVDRSDDGGDQCPPSAPLAAAIQAMWPIAIVQDRYGGTYSGGAWLAVAQADLAYGGHLSRIAFVLDEGPHGDDCDAMEFWMEPPAWIAVGSTPEQALSAIAAAEGRS